MKDRYQFARISNREAKIRVIQHHYLHRWQNATYCFGILDTENANKIVGVLTVACPASWTLRAGAVGETKEESLKPDSKASHVFELNRLWLSDSLPVTKVEKVDPKTGKVTIHRHGVESKFIGWCLRELKSIDPLMVLVSFADTKAEHHGTVYQATNWIYTGVVGGQKDKTKAGVFIRSRKHRYVWFADPARMRDMKDGKMKWRPLPYPRRVMKVTQERTQNEHSWQDIPSGRVPAGIQPSTTEIEQY
jgi:hypothetical protein